MGRWSGGSGGVGDIRGGGACERAEGESNNDAFKAALESKSPPKKMCRVSAEVCMYV